jgi:hypothetical protein
MMIDVAAVQSLADLLRREQSTGQCLEPEAVALTAVTHLVALGYHGPDPRPNLLAIPPQRLLCPVDEPA